MKIKYAMLAILAFCLGCFGDAFLPVKSYQVHPGNYMKHYGSSLDKDLREDGEGRLGLLIDGKNQETGVCYVFWRCKAEDAYMCFTLELSDEHHVSKVGVRGKNNTGMFASPLRGFIETSSDGLEFSAPGKTVEFEAVGIGDWLVELPVDQRARFVRVTLFSSPVKYLNVNELEVFGR
ncbi:MAG: discoidin domain-containing protein [Lentisphaerae bacterium]|jgi:hypothetical protein|nr:discoidin domain-containing protein [Lentisphaerota bacterium]